MLARTHTFTIEGLLTRHVTVELDVRPGLPAFTIVGLADAAVREARERIHAAIRNCGYSFPAQRITANLAPGDVPKAGPGLDLALACAVLAASGQLPRERLEQVALYGELALDGEVRPVRGALAVAHATRRAGMDTLALAPASAREALLVDDLHVAAVGHLQSAARVLGGGPGDPLPATAVGGEERTHTLAEWPAAHTPWPDLSDVRGQHHAVRTLLIAAAGAHNMLFSGPPGTGKTMLAQRLPSILPALSRTEALEVARIHSLTSTRIEGFGERRPFRAPHHSVTTAGLIGGAERTPRGMGGRVGEVVLAHHGVLFLDELSEFSRASLEALRQPLEDGRVAIARAHHSAVYPARFMLVAATNPCPCGYGGEDHGCRCSEADLARHRRRLSGPLLDRIDLLATLQRDTSPEESPGALISSARAGEQVRKARERQAARLRGEVVTVNAHMDARLLRTHARLDGRGQEILQGARTRGMLSARGEDRVVRVARTIADLRGGDRVCARDVGAALALRPDVVIANNRAA
jgi:magnesium chelatase family protein